MITQKVEISIMIANGLAKVGYFIFVSSLIHRDQIENQ